MSVRGVGFRSGFNLAGWVVGVASVCPGVTRLNNTGKYKVQINNKGRIHHIGYYKSEEVAADVFDW